MLSLARGRVYESGLSHWDNKRERIRKDWRTLQADPGDELAQMGTRKTSYAEQLLAERAAEAGNEDGEVKEEL